MPRPRYVPKTNDGMLEGYIVEKIVARFESTGWLHRKVVYQGRRGAGDDWFFGHGERLVIIEFKKPKKDATLQQKREHERFRQRGFKVYVVNNLEDGFKLHARLEEISSLA
jgi:hypothetical protein